MHINLLTKEQPSKVQDQ